MTRAALAALVVGLGILATSTACRGGIESRTEEPNRLAAESSPYLRLHAHNPVDWYPWGEEALERAKKEDKPIFLSVGYSTCYWCHVMEREVFSDPEIAELMNRWFVNIKVDREERPDLDEIYMTATQIMTRHGGWPNSVFLTPELEPFFAGTYFPPKDDRGRPGFPKVLESLHEAWLNRRPEVEARAAMIADALGKLMAGDRGEATVAEGGVPPRSVVERALRDLAARYDAENGGFGGAPKFPSPSNLLLLWEAGDETGRAMVLETLHRMGRGAIYDQLDGAFHRYTLDAAWRVPHFEKMLYDNAHLGGLLAVTAAATGDRELERLARGTLDFVLGTMRLPNGAFKSAIDAETDAVEGAFYIWTPDELAAALDEETWQLLAPIYGFDGPPNFEGGHHTLFLTDSLDSHAARLGWTRDELIARLEPGLEGLAETRSKREFPLVDDKVLTDWNGMMIAALARAGGVLHEPRYTEAAAAAADFVLGMADESGDLLHTWHEGRARVPAFLDDYAFLVRGLLALFEATGEKRWLAEAERLTGEMERRLGDPLGGYFTTVEAADLLVRAKSSRDGAIPSGNGVAVLNLLRLAELVESGQHLNRAEDALTAFRSDLAAAPGGAETLSLALWRLAERGPPVARGPAEEALALVEVEARVEDATGREGDVAVELELDIRDGWHLNANPATLESLVPTRVAGGIGEFDYPAGERLRFAFAEREIDVYSGRVVLAGRAARETRALMLTYQACDDRRCLPPVERTIELDP